MVMVDYVKRPPPSAAQVRPASAAYLNMPAVQPRDLDVLAFPSGPSTEREKAQGFCCECFRAIYSITNYNDATTV